MKINLIFNSFNPTLSFSAEELMHYLTQMDDATLFTINKKTLDCFTIHLEVTNPETLTIDDSYRIQCTPTGILLSGSNERSALLAVYKLLYLMGCRFLQPGKDFEHVPPKDLATFFTDYKHDQTYTASFRHRGVCIEGANSIENVLDFIDWLPKVGYNSFFVQFKVPFVFFDRWYNHIFNPLLSKEGISPEEVIRFSELMEAELQKRDLLYHKVGHGWTCQALGLEDLGWQKTTLSLDADKTNWLALVNGKREYWDGIPTNTNLCYANPEVQKAFVEGVVQYALENPSIDYLHVWLADEHNNLCECEDCRDTLLSDQYISILNLLDEELTKHNTSTKIVFLLYQELLWPPLKEAFSHHERFILMFAPISRTFEKSYEDCIIPDSIPEYVRNQVTLPQSLEENLAFLTRWQDKWTGDSFVYDYPLGRAHYGDVGYMNISKIISRDIKTLKQLNLNGYISCQELRVSFPHSLPNYIMGLTLFDVDTDFDAIASDYFNHLYGEKGPSYQKHFQKLSDLFSCDYFNGHGQRANDHLASNYLEVLEYIQACLENFPFTQDTYYEKRLYFHLNYVRLLALALYQLAVDHPEKAQAYYLSFIEYTQQHELDFQESLDVYRIIEVSTKYTGFSLPNSY